MANAVASEVDDEFVGNESVREEELSVKLDAAFNAVRAKRDALAKLDATIRQREQKIADNKEELAALKRSTTAAASALMRVYVEGLERI